MQTQIRLGYGPHSCLHSPVASASHLLLHFPPLWAKCILMAGCEVTGKWVEQGFSNDRLQPCS